MDSHLVMNKRRISIVLILALMILAVMACDNTPPVELGQPLDIPSSYNQESLQGAYAAAQATQASGQSEMMALYAQATVVSLNRDQAANAAAQATVDYNQRRLMELSIRANEISQNMARAAATQQFITEQNRLSGNATAFAQSQAATATYSAYLLKVTQTAQAQAILVAHATQTAQVYASQTAYPLTATPWAVLQANIIRTQNETERRALWDEFVVTPLKIILPILVVLLLIAGGVIAYRQLMPVLELRLRTISRENDSSLLLVDGMIVDLDPAYHRFTQQGSHLLNHPGLPGDETPQVEIVDSSEPSIINWIIEAERELHLDGRMQS